MHLFLYRKEEINLHCDARLMHASISNCLMCVRHCSLTHHMIPNTMQGFLTLHSTTLPCVGIV